MVSRTHLHGVIWVGTCGFEKAEALAYRGLDIVEVQRTFNGPLDLEVARSWRKAAPPGFRFAIMASQFITHAASSPTYRSAGKTIETDAASRYGGFQDTPEVWAGWTDTQAVAGVLQASAIVFQTPASFGPTETNVRSLYRFLESIRTAAVRVLDLQGVWASHIVEKISDDLDLIQAVDPFARDPATIGLAYFRLHGSPPGPKTHAYTYTDEDLAVVRTKAEEYDDAYVLFNNRTMHDDATRLRRFLSTEPPVRPHR